MISIVPASPELPVPATTDRLSNAIGSGLISGIITPVISKAPVALIVIFPPLPALPPLVLDPELIHLALISPPVAVKFMSPPLLETVEIDVSIFPAVILAASIVKFLPKALILFPLVSKAPPAVKVISPQVPAVQLAKFRLPPVRVPKVILLLASKIMSAAADKVSKFD